MACHGDPSTNSYDYEYHSGRSSIGNIRREGLLDDFLAVDVTSMG